MGDGRMFVVDAVPVDQLPCVLLTRDNWNDWFSYKTMFLVSVVDHHGNQHRLGFVKIGQFGMPDAKKAREASTYASPEVPSRFDVLDESFFSVGLDDNYYETLIALGDETRERILTGLRDVAFDAALWERAKTEDVMTVSLLRDLQEERVTGRFRRLALGNAELTPFHFTYGLPQWTEEHEAPVLEFAVTPGSHPPTNTHVLIGRNGVGKTTCLQSMARVLAARGSAEAGPVHGEFAYLDGEPVANIVSVSFSAFDPFGPLLDGDKRGYAYVGLQTFVTLEQGSENAEPHKHEEEGELRPKNREELAVDFVRAVKACRIGARRTRWRKALRTLESDPLFRESGMTELTEDAEEQDVLSRAYEMYDGLSSGHKIVLLTVTKLVEFVDEKTLVLIDEPEAHLHPPLLAAFVRCLSDLLISRNGVAIVATHSPVVLQEVPKDCVWVVSRSGAESWAKRPELETFGENVGILTREVFGLEVTESGFHSMLEEAVRYYRTYERVVAGFDGKLGGEARAIVRALITADHDELGK